MIKLRSFTQTFSRYAELDPGNSSIIIRQQELQPAEVYAMPGSFDFLDNELLAFFAHNDRRYVFFRNEIIPVDKTDTFSYKRIDSNTCSLSLLSVDGKQKFRIVYHQSDYGAVDRLGWTEEEADRNFGLWLSKQHRSEVK